MGRFNRRALKSNEPTKSAASAASAGLCRRTSSSQDSTSWVVSSSFRRIQCTFVIQSFHTVHSGDVSSRRNRSVLVVSRVAYGPLSFVGGSVSKSRLKRRKQSTTSPRRPLNPPNEESWIKFHFLKLPEHLKRLVFTFEDLRFATIRNTERDIINVERRTMFSHDT